jgi:hypothetical protein
MPRQKNVYVRQNLKLARKWIGKLEDRNYQALINLSEEYQFSIALGDLLLLDGKWYVTHTGLIRLAQRGRCHGINVHRVRDYCDPSISRWVFKATVYKSPRSRGFVGYGDADPSNVSSLVHGAEMRVAETRAVNRALRKAYGIGICSVEELGSQSRDLEPAIPKQKEYAPGASNGHSNGQPRLRDRLCLLVRKHQLDSALVKRYAADFCGSEALRDASRELVEDFINNLAIWASKDRDGLLCKLNSYSQAEEVRP